MQPESLAGANAKRSVSIQESKAYFEKIHKSLSTRSSINQNDWQDLALVWSAADEVNLADSSTVVIVPVADSAMLVNPYLDAYFVFYEDSISSISVNALIFQADSVAYPANSFPTIADFTGLIWEFDFKKDTIGLFKAENGLVIDCGCSNAFMEFAKDVSSGTIQIRTDPDECWYKGWLGEIFSGIGGFFADIGGFIGDVWDAITDFFSRPYVPNSSNRPSIKMGFVSSGTGAGAFGFGNGSSGHGSGSTSGSGSGTSINLSDYFSEWEIKQLQRAAIWMNNKYDTSLSVLALFGMMDIDCMWEISDFVEDPGGPSIDEENEGPTCALAFLLGDQLALSSSEIECISQNQELLNELNQLENTGLLKDVCDINNSKEEMLKSVIQMSCTGDNSISLNEFYLNLNTMDYVYMDQSFLDCGILECVYNRLKATNDNVFCGSIDNFANNPLTRLTLTVGAANEFSGSNNTAHTRTITGPNNVTIAFNPILCDYDYTKSIEIAATMLHEAIHAKMFYDCWPENGAFDDYIHGLPECALYYYGDEEAGQSEEHQHQTMLNAFVQRIAESIDSFSGGAGNWQDWEWLVLSGLFSYSPYLQETWFIEKLNEAYDNYQDNNFNIVYPCQ